jgi:hypothetical protein
MAALVHRLRSLPIVSLPPSEHVAYLGHHVSPHQGDHLDAVSIHSKLDMD